jgi:histidinol-phosphate aminotransferase
MGSMTISRRSFVRAVGITGAGFVASPFITARGREALAAEQRLARWHEVEYVPAAPNAIRLSSNENPRGACAAALEGVKAALGETSLYPFTPPEDLRKAIAAELRVDADNVILGCGSTEVLRMAVDAFASPTRALVTAAPTFEEAADRAQVLGYPIRSVRVDSNLRLDLGAMAAKAPGSGLVFVNNPNNPTGTVHSSAAIESFVRRVLRESNDAVILVDEAYHEYVDDPAYATAIPLALESPRVIVSRTFSKVYGLAGLRVGYAIGQPATLEKMSRHQLGMSVNVLGASGARQALADREILPREKQLNREAREFTTRFFESMGFRVAPSETNFVMADIRRDSRQFQVDCRAHNVLVGRPFPPLTTHARVSIGTMDEMRAATEVFRRLLRA